MSAKKQTKSNKKRESKPKKDNTKNSGSRREASKVPYRDERAPLVSPRIRSILYIAMAAIFTLLIFLPGATVWTVVRSFFFGVFGLGVLLVPPMFIYLTVMNEKEKHEIAHFKAKVALCVTAILLVGALIYCFGGGKHKEINYLAALGNLYLDAYGSNAYIPLEGGFLGGVLGYPLVQLSLPVAIILSLIMLAVIIFILTNLSVRDVASAASRTVQRAREARERQARRRQQRRLEREQYYGEEPAERDSNYGDDYSPSDRDKDSQRRRELQERDKAASEQRKREKPRKKHGKHRRSVIDVPIGTGSSDIDIPLDGGDSRVVPGDNIDVTDFDEGNARDLSESEDLINIINRAAKPFGAGADTTVGDIAEDITRQKRSNHLSNGAKQADPETVPVDIPKKKTEEKPKEKTQDKPAESDEFDNIGYGKSDPVNETKPEKVYHYPPIQLLTPNRGNNDRSAMEEMQHNATKLIDTLNSFGVNASIVDICRGPSVTRYELQPAPGVKISKITNLSDDIALNLAANGVRIEAPIPGKAAVGIEVPNKVVSMVTMRELIDSDEFRSSKSKLTAVLGRDISGQIVTADIAKMPHLLIAGTTGSGKSVCVNSILISILFKASPDEVKLLLIDPKMVEFSKYKGIPHLLVPIVSDAKKAAGALGWAVNEMLNRYKIFSEFDCKDIDSYNELIESNLAYMAENPRYIDEEGEEIQPVLEINGLPVAKEKMCRVVIAIDELADLMMAAPSEVEESICRLAQMARAAGMHLILATQRPTVNVITGLIKANVPSRISLKVSSNMDSRTILDTGGGEKLIGRGDMLFSPVGAPKPIRVQGCYASDKEIEGVTGYIKKSSRAEYNAEIEESIKRIAAEEVGNKKGKDSSSDSGDVDIDAKMEEAIQCVIEAGQASTSLIQRRLKVGYARAGRMIDDMEQLGIVGPHQGSKPRDVLMTYNEWLERRNVLQNNSD